MPGTKDLAALPTSWALSIWDALPLYLAVETALAIVILTLLTGALRVTTWRVSALNLAGGLVYLLVLEPALAVPFVGAAALASVLQRKLLQGNGETPPKTIGSAVRARIWEVMDAVFAAAAVAAVIKILVGPFVASDGTFWLAIALLAGLAPLGSPGTSVIPAAAISSSAESLAAGAVLLLAAATRPLLALVLSSAYRRGRVPADGYD